jgi:uroporphyrinogen decarboxylase
MNSRERFLATMRFQPVDRAPNWEMGYWAGTLDRFHAEGLPRHPQGPMGLVEGEGVKGEGFPWRRTEPKDYAVHEYFGLDEVIEKMERRVGAWPPFEVETLAEDDEPSPRSRDGPARR